MDIDQLKKGYKQTEVGIIPEDWEVKCLGSICKYQNGRSIEKYFNDNGGFTVISIGNYSENGKFVSTGKFVDQSHYKDIEQYILREHDLTILMNDKTPIGTILGRVLLVEENDKYVFNQRTMRLTPKENVESRYLYYLLNSDLLHKVFVSLAKPGTQIYINTNDIIGLSVHYPREKSEQRAIATALADVDALIAALDKLIAKKRAIKTAAMQQLLTGKKRLPAFKNKDGFKQSEIGMIPNDWNVELLPNVAWFQEGPGLRNWQFKKSGMKVINVTNLEDGGINLERTDRHISLDEFNKTYSHFEIQSGDIVMASSGNSYCKTSVVSESDLPLMMNTSVIRFKPINNFEYDFLLAFLISIFFKEQIDLLITGGAQPNFGPYHLRKIFLPVPKPEEQRAIAIILSNMDVEITVLEARRNKTQSIKQGMMQELLTGRTRLI